MMRAWLPTVVDNSALSACNTRRADEEDRHRAHKRGGGLLVPLEFASGEERYQREPVHDETAERLFERRWALTLLDRVVEKLRQEFVHHGRPEHFDRLKVSFSVSPTRRMRRSRAT